MITYIKAMQDLLYEGGPLFMSALTIILLFLCIWSVICFIPLFQQKKSADIRLSKRVSFIKSIGLFALMVGVLGQLIGMYGMFFEIQEIGDLSIKVFFGGLKVAMISTIYGILIYLLSIAIWFTFKTVLINKK